MRRQDASEICLAPLDTEGEWNRPLLENAAAMSNAGCVFASSAAQVRMTTDGVAVGGLTLDELLERFRTVIACEVVRDSESIYEFPAPRGKTAVLVGNEERGIPRSVLKKAEGIVAIPMAGGNMSSVNVAVSAAVALYVFSKDLGRRRKRPGGLRQRNIDILIQAPGDPHEVGSLLRSAWAFGWRRVFMADPHGVWVTQDHQTVLEGRAAARRSKNPLAVLPVSQLQMDAYDRFWLCTGRREGMPLSRTCLPSCHRLLVVCGDGSDLVVPSEGCERVFVDHTNPEIQPRFRHAGSILLSMVSEMAGG